jgi:mono/diheme cytochrome c family protein/cbb3-type cytochrome oxidase cytochrome c subunit
MQREGLSQETATHRYKGMTFEQREHYAMEHFAEHRATYARPETVQFDPDKPYNVPIFSRFAPELSGVGSKVNFDWLYSWLIEPQHYAADSKMPRLRLTPREAADLATYLLTLRNDEFQQVDFPMDDRAKKMADDLIFQLLAAQRSERRSRAVMNDEGGELSEMLVAGLKGSDQFGTEEPRRVENARKLVSSMSLEDKKMTFLGSKMIGHYGCYACHMIAGFETTTPPGTDLTAWAEKPITQLDFAFYGHAFHGMREEKEDVFGYVYPHEDKLLNLLSPIPDDQREEITHTHHAFAQHKLLNPRIWDREKIKRPYDKLKMPNFYFNRDEAASLTTYLLSRVPPRVSGPLQIQYQNDVKGPIARGRALTRELNCIACHQVEENVSTIHQYFRRDIGGKIAFDIVNAPPLLWGEGAKAQHHWLHSFLKNVITLRPWLQVRMPSFALTNEQATTLVEYFAALSQHDSRELSRSLGPINEYFAPIRKSILGKESESESFGEEAKVTKADPSWYKNPNLERPAEDLRDWAVDRLLVRPDDVDPLKTPAERVTAAHMGLLEKARFLRDLYKVEYPFVEPPVSLRSEERFETGQNFMVDMGCLKCHVLGPMVLGPARNTTEFVQVYRLDGVRGDGSEAVAVLNGKAYPVGSEIDGHKLISATNTFHPTGDIETKAVVEGPGDGGKTERVLLVAPSAPNLGLASQRLQRDWLYHWMLNPQWIQPGTKMPMNFPLDKETREPTSPFAGEAKYKPAGTESEGAAHINLLIDYLYDAGMRNARVALPKLEAPSESEDFEEGGGEAFED